MLNQGIPSGELALSGSWPKMAHGIQDGMGLRRFARSFPLLVKSACLSPLEVNPHGFRAFTD
jgi:hypothetical protein